MEALIAARAVLAATLFTISIAGHASGDTGARASLGELARSGRLSRRAVDQAQRDDWSFIHRRSYQAILVGRTTVLHQGEPELAARVGALTAAARSELAPYLGPLDALPLRVYLVRDPGRELTCASASYESEGAIHLAVRDHEWSVVSDGQWLMPALRHELVHLSTIPKRGGRGYLPWISEGLAYYLESRPDAPDVRVWLDHLAMPPPDVRCRSWRELDEWADFYRAPGFESQSAAVFGVLEARAGCHAVRRFVLAYFDGARSEDEAFIEASGLPMEELEVFFRSLASSPARVVPEAH